VHHAQSYASRRSVDDLQPSNQIHLIDRFRAQHHDTLEAQGNESLIPVRFRFQRPLIVTNYQSRCMLPVIYPGSLLGTK